LPKIDAPATTSSKTEKRGERWVEIPEKDLFDFPFPTIRINLQAFGPGKHFVDADTADWIEERVRVRENADKHILMRNPDTVSQDALNRFGSGRGGNFVRNPDAVMPS
jgi:hypothetical protein